VGGEKWIKEQENGIRFQKRTKRAVPAESGGHCRRAEDTIKPRLVSAGANCSRIAFIDESEKELTLYDERIENAIRDSCARMMVIDPLQAFLSDGSEMNRADGVRPMMRHCP